MDNKLLSALLWCVLAPVLVTVAVPGIAQVSVTDNGASNSAAGAEKSDNEIPLHSISQYKPCPGQTTSFRKLYDSFAAGHPPSSDEATGSWALIGFWLHKESHPDLNCAGIMRGKILEWVMLAVGYSLRVDMAGTLETATVEHGHGRDLTVALDIGGDASPLLRCRLTQRDNLVCLGDTYYNGLEFRKIQVHCEPQTPTSRASDQRLLCFPGKNP